MKQNPTILGLASEFKGAEFIKECKKRGCKIIILARETFRDHPWPHDCIDAFHTMPDLRVQPDLTNAVTYLMRHQQIDRIVALDDFDVEHAADLREHIRMPGMLHSQARLFRDKLAMRSAAQSAGIPQPRFTGLINHNRVYEFMTAVPAPWIFKPRTLAGSEGIQKFTEQEQVWQKLEELGDAQSQFLLEEFIPGNVFHVDSLSWQGTPTFALASAYGAPPLTMLQGQKLFSTRTLDQTSDVAQHLLRLNQQLLTAFARDFGPSHSEFIQGQDGTLYFLETSARVAGGNIERVIESATDIKVWQEAAKMELADYAKENYQLSVPEVRYAGLIATPIKDSTPDVMSFQAQEITFRFNQDGFITLVIAANSQEKRDELLSELGRQLLA